MKTDKSKQLAPLSEAISPETMEKVIIGSDLAGLNPNQRVEYYLGLCKSLDLNPATRPFEFITLDGKMVLYPRRDATDQIRKRDGIVIKIISRVMEDGLYIVTASGKNAAGREDESIGVESMAEPPFVKAWDEKTRTKSWQPNPLANHPLPPATRAVAMMKAETKAKRRVTLSLGGLGMMDESEIEGAIQGGELPSNEPAKPTIEDRKAEIEKNGGSVTEIKPEPEKENVSSKTPGDWREVVSHVGKAEGPILGKKIGELCAQPALIRWLAEKWLPKAGKTKKDIALAEAVKAALETLPPETPVEPPKAETAVETPKTPEKAATGQPEAQELALDGDSAPKKEEKKPIAWKTVKVHIPNKAIFNKELGTLTLPELRATFKQLLPKIDSNPEKQTVVDRIFINAVHAAVIETGAFDAEEWLATLDEAKLREEIGRRLRVLKIETKDADEKLEPITGAPIAEAPKEMLLYLIKNWQTVTATLTEE